MSISSLNHWNIGVYFSVYWTLSTLKTWPTLCTVPKRLLTHTEQWSCCCSANALLKTQWELLLYVKVKTELLCVKFNSVMQLNLVLSPESAPALGFTKFYCKLEIWFIQRKKSDLKLTSSFLAHFRSVSLLSWWGQKRVKRLNTGLTSISCTEKRLLMNDTVAQ